MRPAIIPPGRRSDGYQVVVLDDQDRPRFCLGTGATRDDAVAAAMRSAFVMIGQLARGFERDRAYEQLHRAAAMFLAGRADAAALARACADVERGKAVRS